MYFPCFEWIAPKTSLAISKVGKPAYFSRFVAFSPKVIIYIILNIKGRLSFSSPKSPCFTQNSFFFSPAYHLPSSPREIYGMITNVCSLFLFIYGAIYILLLCVNDALCWREGVTMEVREKIYIESAEID